MIGYLTSDSALIHAFARPRPARRTRRETLEANRIFKLAPKLADCFRDGEVVAVRGPLDRPISGLVTDSRRVLPGTVFFALPGRRTDGAAFIADALSRGAIAVVARTLPAHAPAGVTCVQVADPRAALARAAQRHYRFPDRDLGVIGVAGAHGKTTVAHLLHHLLGADRRIGLIGSIAYDLGARTVPAYRTTPESLDVFGLLAQMRDAGCRQAVVEISAEGLAQQRVGGVRFGAVVIANLGPAVEGVAETDAAVLLDGRNGPVPPVAVVNLDDVRCARLAEELAAAGSVPRVVTFGENPRAQVRAENPVFGRKRTSCRLVWPGGGMEIDAPLTGRRNLGNLLAAVAAAWGLGRDPQVVLARLRAFGGVPGRLESVDGGQPFDVLVDYAHSAAALRHTLSDLRTRSAGRLLVVFGCGGGGAPARRAAMTAAVQAHADFAVATADNPRHEKPAAIFAAMQAGATAPARITWIEDRRRAISLALDLAKPGDCVVIAGKGHEGFQEFADTVVPFDDRIVARELLQRKMGRSPGGAVG